MTPDTSKLWAEAARDARSQVISEQTVVALRSAITGEHTPVTPYQQVVLALQSLERALMQLEILGDDIACPTLVARLDAIDTRLTRRWFALNMRLGIVRLAGVMGRAP